MFNKGKLDVNSFTYRISTTKERELCTTCRALLGFVMSLTNTNTLMLALIFPLTFRVITNQFLAAPSRKANFLRKFFCTNAIDQN